MEGEAESHIAKLGDDSFESRENATRALESMGRFAEPALRRVLEISRDAEIRARARSHLDRMKPTVSRP